MILKSFSHIEFETHKNWESTWTINHWKRYQMKLTSSYACCANKTFSVHKLKAFSWFVSISLCIFSNAGSSSSWFPFFVFCEDMPKQYLIWSRVWLIMADNKTKIRQWKQNKRKQPPVVSVRRGTWLNSFKFISKILFDSIPQSEERKHLLYSNRYEEKTHKSIKIDHVTWSDQEMRQN